VIKLHFICDRCGKEFVSSIFTRVDDAFSCLPYGWLIITIREVNKSTCYRILCGTCREQVAKGLENEVLRIR